MRPTWRATSSRALPPAPAAFVPRVRRSVLLGLVAIACAGQACAGHGAARGRGDSSMITREQIIASHYNSAYEVVEALHGNWLRSRGANSFQAPGEVVVYMDNSRLGGTDTLRGISATTIGSIRFIDANAAQARWGIGHTQGVIYVATHLGS